MAFDWAAAHGDQVEALVEQSSKAGFIASLASESSDRAVAARVKAHAVKTLPPSARSGANASVAQINFRADLRARLAPAIGAWIKAQ